MFIIIYKVPQIKIDAKNIVKHYFFLARVPIYIFSHPQFSRQLNPERYYLLLIIYFTTSV